MSAYTVTEQPDGKWTVVLQDGDETVTLPGWRNETQARLAACAYRPKATRRDWAWRDGKKVWSR